MNNKHDDEVYYYDYMAMKEELDNLLEVCREATSKESLTHLRVFLDNNHPVD